MRDDFMRTIDLYRAVQKNRSGIEQIEAYWPELDSGDVIDMIVRDGINFIKSIVEEEKWPKK